MKKSSFILLISACMVFLYAGGAFATSVTYEFLDYTNVWENYYDGKETEDVIGNPQVTKMTVTVSDTGYLETVTIDIANRLTWDALFIQVDYDGSGDFDWDYFVFSGVDDNNAYDPDDDITGYADALYSVSDGYQYTTVDNTSGREGHPNGIKLSYLNTICVFTVTETATQIIYNFTDLTDSDGNAVAIYVGSDFLIGYSPWCANDVILGTPVPEPTTMLLLGLGLIGLAGASRKKIKL